MHCDWEQKNFFFCWANKLKLCLLCKFFFLFNFHFYYFNVNLISLNVFVKQMCAIDVKLVIQLKKYNKTTANWKTSFIFHTFRIFCNCILFIYNDFTTKKSNESYLLPIFFLSVLFTRFRNEMNKTKKKHLKALFSVFLCGLSKVDEWNSNNSR